MQMARSGQRPDRFEKLHRAFVEHYGIALGFVWASALVAAAQAPWTRNIRGLIDPLARPESTMSFLFGLPILMTLGWVALAFGGDVIRRGSLLRNEAVEFGLAGVIAFALFCMSISRAVTVVSLGG